MIQTQEKLPLILFSLGFLALAGFFTINSDFVVTHFHNSEITYLKARDMAAGDHQYGLFFEGDDLKTPRYEFHMPEGPTYIMAAWLALGLPEPAFRAVPILTSLAAHLLFLLALFQRYGSSTTVPIITLACAFIIYQPTTIAWTKAVDEGSYNFSLLMLCFAVILRGWHWGWIALLGFLMGCNEVNRHPMMAMTIFLLVTVVTPGPNYGPAFRRAFFITLVFTIMVTLATVLHIVHVGWLWNDIPASFENHIGTLLGRADLNTGITPELHAHYKHIAESHLEGDTGRFSTIVKLFETFFWFDWQLFTIPIVFPVVYLGFLLHKKALAFRMGAWSLAYLPLHRASQLVLLALIPTIWTLMVPNHANVHYYYISHDLKGWIWGMVFIALETRLRNSRGDVLQPLP